MGRNYTKRFRGNAFLALAAGVRTQVPWVATSGLRAKVDGFAAHRDEYDAVYLGSSHVFHSFRPDVIDPLVSGGPCGFLSLLW